MKTPCRVTVKSVVSSRYGDNLKQGESRPLSWDQRKEGRDIIISESGENIPLFCDGGQSVPQPGWVLLLTDGDTNLGYRWTLFGMPKGTEILTS